MAFQINPARSRSSRPCINHCKSRGSASVEMVLLAPLLIVVTLFVVYLGRAGGGAQQVRHAADVAARSASVVRSSRMQTQAAAAAQHDLVANGVNCSSVEVTTNVVESAAASSVTVTVSCVINQSGLSLLGTSSRTVTATSTEVIDRYRAA